MLPSLSLQGDFLFLSVIEVWHWSHFCYFHNNASLMRHVQLTLDWSLCYIANNWLSIHPSTDWLSSWRHPTARWSTESLQAVPGSLGLLPKEAKGNAGLISPRDETAAPLHDSHVGTVKLQSCSCVTRGNPHSPLLLFSIDVSSLIFHLPCTQKGLEDPKTLLSELQTAPLLQLLLLMQQHVKYVSKGI